MKALKIILLALALIPLQAHAGLLDDLGSALGGDTKNETATPDTAQPTDKQTKNLAVKETGNTAKRVALVIGNDRYSTVPPLKNAVADARSMAAELKRAGFDVTLKTDANLDAMKLAVRQFKASLSGGDEAVFFYSGHGVQLGGANYLLPVNITSDNEEQVKDDAIPLQRLLDDLQDQKVKFALAIIDACRDNPFKAAGKRSIGGTRGLAATSAANGQMVIFSAGNGQQALDKLGDTDRDKNGVFTRVFLQEMQKPGLEVHQVVQGVRRRVDEMAKSVKHDQVPAMYDQVVGDFHFYPGIGQGTQTASLVPVPVRVKTKEEIEDDYWDDIKDSNDLSSFEKYSKAYPEGRYINPASHKIDQLKKKAQDALPVTPPPVVVQAPARTKKSGEEIEDEAWENVRNSGNIGAIQEYLKQYPKGQYAASAKILLTTLKPAPAKPAEPTTPPGRQDNETALWNEVKNSTNKDDYDAYLSQYPKGKYIALAKSRIKKLQEEAANEAVRKEQEAWEAAGKSESEDGYQSYLKNYPQGNYAGMAQVRIRKLQTDQAAREEQQLWQQVQTSDNAQTVQRYLDKYPDSSHAAAAREKLAAIQQAKQEREAVARREAERQRQQAEAAPVRRKLHDLDATSDKRIALVIGNSAYTDSPLKNPVNDAKDMANKLRRLGFDVIERSNLQTKQIGGTLREFRSKLAPGAVALVFYAGHGLQIKGINYLPAVDADINSEGDVPNQSIAVNQIMDVLDESKTRLNLVFLDACRNNPYARSFRSSERGLARVSVPSGTLISYATRPGSVAADGEGRNGLYTSKLLAQMDSNLQIEQVLKQVVTAVKAASQGKQEPWMEGSIEGDFCFAGCQR